MTSATLPESGADATPVLADPRTFNHQSGSLLERAIFNHRALLIALAVIASVLLGWRALHLQVNASFDKMIPQSHPYMRNYLENRGALRGLGSSLHVIVENRGGDIYQPEYLELLRKVNDALFVMDGADRPYLKSLWRPTVRWTQVTEVGMEGGPVMPARFDGGPASVDELKRNLARSASALSLISADGRATILQVPLLERNPETGQPLDYRALNDYLETKVRGLQSDTIKIRIVGFAKLNGDLIAALHDIAKFFALSVVIAAVLILWHTRCLRSTVMLVSVSVLSVVWLLGLIELGGHVLNPYSALVPFLVFSIGLSHGAQKMNGIMQDIGRGTHRYVAARYTFRRLFMAGLAALLVNVVGFAVLMLIDIPVIRELAGITSLGVLILVLTKLVLIPVVLSYIGVSPAAALRTLRSERIDFSSKPPSGAWSVLSRFTQPRWAGLIVATSIALGAICAAISLTLLQVGDLEPGAPELKATSRYNQDVAYLASNFRVSTDQLVVMVKTEPGLCDRYATLLTVDRLTWALEQIESVQGVSSLSSGVRSVTAGLFEGFPKWGTLSRNQDNLNRAVNYVALYHSPELVDSPCSISNVVVALTDHKAETLERVLAAVEELSGRLGSEHVRLLPVAGNAGIEAVTNIEVRRANYKMLGLLYAAVALLCYVTFRSWRAVLTALIPLVIISFMCEALMVMLGIGLKVATLPVIALGVGVGVDYALYLLTVQLRLQRQGVALGEAHLRSVQFTGRVVALIGLTMTAGVATWAWSPIKSQADMGILLAFMFFLNMVAALVLVPALSHFLLRDVGQRGA